MIARLIAILFLSREVAHREHLNTKSYAQHMALGSFYDTIVDNADSIAEAYQGRHGLIGKIPMLTETDTGDIADILEKHLGMLEKIKKINEEEQQESRGLIKGIEIKPEQVGNMWYAYSADDSQYLGQGPTLDEALKMVADRFPNKKFWCKKPNESNQSS